MKRIIPLILLTVVLLIGCKPKTGIYMDDCAICLDTTAGVDNPDSMARPYHTWKDKVSFQDAAFGPSVDFRKSMFLDTAAFTGAVLGKSANFSYDTFKGPVYFDDVTFARNTHFTYVSFSHYAKFTNLRATDSISIQFDDATLPDTIDFSQNPALLCKIDLTTANFNAQGRSDTASGAYIRPHYIFLFNSDISKFKLDYFHFRLLVPDSTITPSLGAQHQRISIDQKEAMYEALLNNFKQNGQDESYQLLDIEYQTFKWHHSWAPWVPFLLRLWWNFGYDKEFVFLWIIGGLLVFTLICSCYLRTMNAHVYEAISPVKIKDLTKLSKRIWYSFYYTANVFFRLTLDRSCMRFERLGLTIYFFLIYALGTLCLGYLANFILQH